jgi:hypothetical protein
LVMGDEVMGVAEALNSFMKPFSGLVAVSIMKF